MAPTKAFKVAQVEKSRREAKGKKTKKASTPPPPGEPRYDDNDDLIVDGQFEPTASGSGLNERGAAIALGETETPKASRRRSSRQIMTREKVARASWRSRRARNGPRS
jgi:hypothetical protein